MHKAFEIPLFMAYKNNKNVSNLRHSLRPFRVRELNTIGKKGNTDPFGKPNSVVADRLKRLERAIDKNKNLRDRTSGVWQGPIPEVNALVDSLKSIEFLMNGEQKATYRQLLSEVEQLKQLKR